jgi:[NiFe] hydrogenase assembly HybE family chaperone
MSNEIYGYTEKPTQTVEAAFTHVAERSMNGLSFIHPAMPIKACGFSLFEGQWIGAVLTPWMLSALILPGPDQVWPQRNVGERIGLKLPYGDMTFIVGELDGLGQYLSSSLISPLDRKLSVEQGIALAEDSIRILLSLPIRDGDAPSNLGRRALFSSKT